VGGYPRAFNVISADVDLLGQYAPLQFMRFRLVSIEEARSAALLKRADIERLKNRFS
jgi:allophanate hydrolase subunit 2